MLLQKIKKIKKEKKVTLIAHYYQESELQDLADYVGDSYGMAVFAKQQNNPLIVVCGVRFMAETIKVINPTKKVLLPDLNAGCSLADSCTPEVFSYFLSKYPGAFVMTYINSSLPIKTMSDVICTSSNAVKIASQIPKDRPLVFGPDQHLGRFIQKKLGKPMALFPGSCFVHMSFSLKELHKLANKHSTAVLIAHPECDEAILNMAEFVGSTSQLLEYTKTSPQNKFIVLTEAGIAHQMQKASPTKEFIMGPDLEGCACNNCPHMKLNTLEKLLDCLEKETPEITIEPEMLQKAKIPIDRMIQMTQS